MVDAPDMNGRLSILRVHCKGKTLDPDVNLETVARRTPGAPAACIRQVCYHSQHSRCAGHALWFQLQGSGRLVMPPWQDCDTGDPTGLKRSMRPVIFLMTACWFA